MSGVTNPVYRFSGLSESDSTNGGVMGGKGNGRDSGCHVSTAIGFVLVLLAVLIAVGVGLIVHFAEKGSNDRELTCTFPDNVLAELLKQTQDQGSTKAPTVTPTIAPPATQPATPTAGPTLRPPLTPSLSPSAPTTATPVQRSHRLPTDLNPLFYNLEIQPDIYGNDPSTFTFNGSVVIHFECVAQTSAIVLNAKNLSIQEDPTVQSSAGRTIEAAEKYVLDDAAETLTIKLKEQLRANEQYKVTIRFSGPLTDDLTGLYLSSYKRGNATVYLATTQFESPDAREAFPCFDEPAMKAHFNVTIVRKSPLVSLSNTQIVRTVTRANGWMADVYETTPKMSTYLLAIIVCDFEKLHAVTNKSVQFEVWARRELLNQTRFALDVGMKILDYYGDFFGIDFPLKKQAMVAIPDFGNGAMENWGLVTYRENYLTIQEGVTSEGTKNNVALYIAHELAHQWFGNLVTLAWWDDLWLNEGFASFVEYIGLDYIDKNWKVWEQFVVDSIQRSFELDQLASSHPLYSPVQAVEEADQYFDTISYEKGSSVIRMLQFVMGTDTFHRGLQKYLRDHEYGNANHTDLWNSLAKQAQSENRTLDIDDIMNTWTEQMGFPVVKVTRSSPTGVSVTQKRFLINPDAKDPGIFHSTFGYKWWVPVTLATSKDTNFNVTYRDVEWMSKYEESKTIHMAQGRLPDADDSNGWILANVQQYGYYRVNYDESNWNALIKQLQKDHTVIPPINRAQIIDDAWNLASAGETNISTALGTLEYLGAEMDYIPWKVASIQIGSLKTHMADSSHYGALNRFIQDRIRSVFNQLGLDDTGATALESYTRSTVANIACGAGLPECVNQVVQLFKKWRDDPNNNPISPNVRSQVYCAGVSKGDESDWLFILKRYRQETSPNEKRLLRRALSCTSRSYIMNTLLKMSLERGDIRRDDATGMIGYVAGSSAGSRMAWDFIREHWGTIMRDFSQSASMLKFMVDSIASRFHEEFHLNELKAFMNSLGEMGSAEQTLTQALETVEFNIKWYKNSYPQIKQWLEDKGYHEFEGSESKTSTVTKEDVLLPDDIRPSHYDLVIEPYMYGSDPAKFTFNGTLAMTFTCVKATDQIVMHAYELEVTDIKLTSPSSPPFVSQKLDTDKQFLIIKLGSRLTPGQNYSVSMHFEGKLENDRDGLYLSSYKNGNTTVYLATTQFEAVAARKAFPCMDEPALKATFATTIIRRTWNLALSNMPLQTSTNMGGDRVADKFQTSLPMSSYLVALIVCDFRHKTSYTKTGNITYEVWGRPSAYGQLDFALEFGVKAIDYFQDYFAIPFPLPKQSMIGIPDFSAGAMENWGLITYRETRVLVEEGVSSQGDKEASAMTIAHELAHMWFGDLVTPEWWDDIWLNEGFARFMQYLATDFVYPNWKEWDQFVTVVVHKGMKLDGYVSSHPVFVPVATPDKINEVFDSISYDKGASVIRMIRHAIGYDTFKRGITNYLNSRKYGNADHTDLWNALNAQARLDGKPVDVGDVMDTWTLQMNYPVVTVKRIEQTLSLTQNRFLRNPTAKDIGTYQSPFGYKWDIPFTYTTSVHPDFNETRDVIWMLKNETNKTIPLTTIPPATGWFLANVKEVGYYRVNYEDANWLNLANQLRTNHSVIDPVNRAQIINDAWNLAWGGYLNQSIALRVVEYLDIERDYVPWKAAANELNYVSAMLVTTGLYGAFKDFLANKSMNQYQELGMNNSNAALLESFLRSQIASTACGSGVEDCVNTAKALYAAWRSHPGNNPISPEVRSTVYCTAVRYGSVADWDFLYGRYVTEENVNEKNRLMFQLPCSKEIWVLSRLLDRVLSSDDIRGQDKMYIVQNVLSNSAGRALAWRYLRENWDTIFKLYGLESFTLSNVASTIGETFNTRTELEELENFVSTHPNLGTAARAFQVAIESVRSNVRWMDERYDVIKDWLQGLGYYKP